MATDRQQEIPDPLRNLQVADVVSITQHAAFQRPQNIAEPDWQRAVEEVRTAARAIKLDLPIEQGNQRFLVGLCREVDRRVRAHRGDEAIDKARLHDPVIEAVREQIGLFISVRVRLGRNEQFRALLDALTMEKGIVTLVELDKKYGLKAITSTLRAIAKGAFESASRREAVWGYIKEFLAEQAGLVRVDFPGQEFEDASSDEDFRKKLRALGIELSHLDIVEREGRRFAQSHGEALEATRAEMAVIDDLLPKLRKALVVKGGAVNLAERKIEVPPNLKRYFAERKRLDDAIEDLKEVLEVAELDPKGKEMKAYRKAVAKLEGEFAKPLAAYWALEKAAIAAEEQRAALDRFIKELEGKLITLRALETLLDRLMKTGEAEQPAAPGAAPPARVGQGEFTVDDRVLHRSLGPGTVLRVDKAGGVIEIQFERRGAGIKTFKLGDADQYLVKRQQQ